MFLCLVQLVKMLSYYWNHNNKLSFINTDNPSVKASLKTVLEPIDVSKYKRN